MLTTPHFGMDRLRLALEVTSESAAAARQRRGRLAERKEPSVSRSIVAPREPRFCSDLASPVWRPIRAQGFRYQPVPS